MSKADDIFWRQFGTILAGLTLFGFAMAFLARGIAGDAHQVAMNSPMAIAARILPIGEVRVGDPSQMVAAAPKANAAPAMIVASAADSGPVDGEQVYNTACMACHVAGVAGAPKKGDQAAWAPRIALGEDALVQSVLNGKGAMPPKAGNPNLTEEQIRAAVQFLTGSGGTGAISSAKEAVATATAAAAETVKEVAAAANDTAQQAVDKVDSMASATSAAVGQAAGAVSDTVTGAASAATSAVTAAASSVAAASTSAVPAASEGKPGAEVYNAGCVACHVTGAANAPKLNDKAAWETRAATGFAALLHSVTNGKGAMPARGGLSGLSDADVANAIRYMLKEAGVEAGG